MNKIKPAIKKRIIRLFTNACPVKDIIKAVKPDFPKITPARIKTVLRQHLIKRADKLWSTAITQVDKCEISGQWKGKLQAHHLIGRTNLKYRWDLSNGICLSAYHHTLSNEIAAHGSTDVTERFAEWMITNRPGQWGWFIEHKDDKAICQPTNEELLEICNVLEQIVNDGSE